MANAVSAAYELKCVATETLDLSADYVTNVDVVHNLGSVTGTLNATSTVPATKASSDQIALVAGASSLDLTSLTGLYGASVDFTGLKVQLVMITCPSSNTGGITFDVGAANGYNLFGADNASDESVEVMPGGTILMYHPNNLEDVDATHKAVDITGTGTETFDILLVAG